MNLGQAILEALESLSSNKLRSSLTILGIVIGVGAVIAMMAVGAGAQETITGSISGIGSNLLFVIRGNSTVELTRLNHSPLKTRKRFWISSRLLPFWELHLWSTAARKLPMDQNPQIPPSTG